MNERIRQLAIDAGGHGMKMSTIGLSLLGEKQIEKFAELIVKECASIAHGSDMPSKDIKEHFGVEL